MEIDINMYSKFDFIMTTQRISINKLLRITQFLTYFFSRKQFIIYYQLKL